MYSIVGLHLVADNGCGTRGRPTVTAADAAAAPAVSTQPPAPDSPQQPQPPPPPQQQQQQQPPGFIARRLAVFSGLVLGYAAYYLTRNSLTYTAPVMVADPTLGFTLAEVGTMTSIFPIAYALGAGTGLAWFAAMWALNGLMQGVGAPSCARMLTSWFPARERGTYWGLWNVAHNTGGFLSPLVAATAAHAAGWRWGMWAPGLAGLALGVFVLLVCRDTPQDAGFNPVEVSEHQKQQEQQQQQKKHQQSSEASTGHGSSSSSPRNGNTATTSGSSSTSTSITSGKQPQQQQQQQKPGVLRTAIDNVLSNPYIWALALTYFCVYVVRQGVTSWTVFYLISEKGVPDAAQAAMRVSGLELGGLVGGLAAGRISDLLIRKGAAAATAATAATAAAAAADGGHDGRSKLQGTGKQTTVAAALGSGSVGLRVQVVMAYTAALAAALAAFQSLPPGVPPALQWLSMLIGLCGAELVHPGSVGASQGVLGWVAYLGAANAGVPLSWIITRFGWSGYFTALTAACGVALLLLLPLMRLPSYTQRQAQQQEQVQQQMAAAARVAAGADTDTGKGGTGAGAGGAGLEPKLA
ncbi:hypothetical protein VOLCADRAFT_85912 [Volvox carteri f. nagariensis]|uniref:Major facilitator superfamily (MFS) profile domain-containing protein n=1 Tax=Volvox carteri f. nagariensis TaxID=3068 RepID=D8THB8_VOLCA|nr:uncharacterized protein VOLCADRAFT_85912 [Volvox carteri f. nagariensis]EFJ53044.1 hypothetical protein VOLCADRAFT_85912 [Volvox carteri f. nagariensis]|eukprot:XP_002946049.1 hypothetical protein VOLCADRAFT_85912 [Volvox carteri f. nagariensis]